MATQIVKPEPGVCYGITHALDGSPVVREPKVLKVGIGLPKGPAINVYRAAGKWNIQVGFKGKDSAPKAYAFETRAEAQAEYKKQKASAPACKFPRKVGYFTFTRQAADGTFEPDWNAIEAHGDLPTEIDVVFLSDSPLDASYQMWSTSELRCKGDGRNAERVLAMAATQDEKAMAEGMKQLGIRYFPILDGCWTMGCPYAKADSGKASLCKPSGELKFQLVNNLRIGGTAYFHTTGFRSISQLFSCIQIIKTMTGGGDPARGHIAGIPLKLTVRPYHTRHEGQPSTQYGVALEFREETVEALTGRLIEQATRFQSIAGGVRPRASRQVAEAAPKMLSAPPAEIASDEEEPDESARARAISDEFAGDGGEDETPADQQEMHVGTAAEREAVLQRRLREVGASVQGADTAEKETAEEHDARLERQMTEQADALRGKQEPSVSAPQDPKRGLSLGRRQ